MVSKFGNSTAQRVNTREVKAIGRTPAPRRSSTPMRACRVIARLFTGIRGDIRANRSEFAKRCPLIARHCRSIRGPKSHRGDPKTKRCDGCMAVRTVSQRTKGEDFRESVLDQETRAVLAEPRRRTPAAAPRFARLRVQVLRRQRTLRLRGSGGAHRKKTELLRRNVELLDFRPNGGNRIGNRLFAFLVDLLLKFFELRSQLPVGRHMDGTP